MPSKMVTDRQKSSAAVEAAARVHADEVFGGLAPLLLLEIRPGEVLPDFALGLRLLARALGRRRALMVAADEANLTELTDDGDPRRRRDEAAAELRDRLSDVRRTVEGLFGRERTAELLGLDGELAFDPPTLQLQAERAVALLRGQAVDTLPESRLPGVTLDPAAWATTLEEPLAELTRALAEVARERREAETTLAAKSAAIADYDAVFGRVARLTEALFAAAELPLLAARVRPSGRRPGRTAEDVAEGANPPPEAEADPNP